jgi:hypothetical protein
MAVMYVARVPNRGSRPAVLLRESYREGGKVKNRTLANLSSWPEAKVESLAAVLKGQAPATGLRGAFEISRSLPHGHVAAVLGTLRSLGVEELISPVPSRQRDLVTAMITAAVIDGSSKLATARGLRAETAASSLGALLGLEACDEDDLYAAMDWLLPRQPGIEDALAARHLREGTLVLYDVSSAAFEGRTCPPGQIGHPRDGVRGRLQIVYGGADHPGGDPGRGRGVQGRHRRPGHPDQPGHEDQVPVRPDPRGGRRGPGDAGQGPHPRRPPARAPGLDHRAARPGDRRPDGRRRDPAHPTTQASG